VAVEAVVQRRIVESEVFFFFNYGLCYATETVSEMIGAVVQKVHDLSSFFVGLVYACIHCILCKRGTTCAKGNGDGVAAVVGLGREVRAYACRKGLADGNAKAVSVWFLGGCACVGNDYG